MAPPLKNPLTRQRRNKPSTATVLRADPALAVPALPELDKGVEWHKQTVAWWASLWASPMAPEYDPSDVHGLYVLAALVDRFWRDPSKELAGEIRLQRMAYGLSPIDRRRLHWKIEQFEPPAPTSPGGGDRPKRGGTPKAEPADAYGVLRAVV